MDDQDRVLVIKRADNGHWEMPGGVLELGETFENGVRREVAEETGMNVAVERLSGVYKNMSRGIVALVFRCRPESASAHDTDEAQEVCWMSDSEVVDAMTPAYAVRILDASKNLPQVRTHDGVDIIS